MSLSLVIGLGAVFAAVVALVIWRQPVLAFTQRSAVFLGEVKAEVRRISWPGWEDLRRSTLVIIIIVILLGVLIGLMDWIFSKILIDLFGRIFA